MTPGTSSALNYGFDASGNPTELPTGATGTYDDASELASAVASGTTTTYSYSADGERTKATQGGLTALSATYDGASRLTSYDNSLANMSNVSYDGDNLRQSETTTPSGGSAVTEYFTWNPEAATPELLIDSTNAYVYGIDSTPIEQVSLSTGAVKYLVADALGSVRGVVNGSSGSLTGTTAYDAWGNPETSGGLLVYTPFGYAGGYTDSTGLSYFINRYYDPETGQFLTVDPMVTETGQPYAYAYDDPVDLSDVSGECAGLLGGSNQTLAAESVSLASGACIAFHYYRRHHLSPNAAAGIVGNLLQESQMEPYAGQGTAHQGIAQWSPARWGKLVRTANREQKNPWGRWFQITYVLNEMRTSFYSTVYGVLKNPSVSLDRATTVVFEYYEAPGDNSLSTRISYAREVKRVCS